jgi:Bacteriophage Gp15 protein.
MNPQYVEVEGERYKINTSYNVALKCNEIAENKNIGDYERALAIIYRLFGDKGLDCSKHHKKLLELAQKYLLCGKESVEIVKREDPDMDFKQDMDYIEASFITDHQIDLETTKMHWWKFNKLVNGLKEDCILNRVRFLRNYDTKDIKDIKEREKIERQKQDVALKKEIVELTQEEIESANLFDLQVGIAR